MFCVCKPRPENNNEPHQPPQCRNHPVQPAVFRAQPQRQRRRPDRHRRGQRARQVHALEMHRRHARCERGRDHQKPGTDDRHGGAERADRPDAGEFSRGGAPGAAGRPDRQRKLARRCRARRDGRAGGVARAAACRAERRLAKAGADRAGLGDGTGRAAARRADQPSRSRQDRASGRLAERAAPRHAGDPVEPRPRLSRHCDQPHAFPAAGELSKPSPSPIPEPGQRSTRRIRRMRSATNAT
jgi:hypothetical protein